MRTTEQKVVREQPGVKRCCQSAVWPCKWPLLSGLFRDRGPTSSLWPHTLPCTDRISALASHIAAPTQRTRSQPDIVLTLGDRHTNRGQSLLPVTSSVTVSRMWLIWRKGKKAHRLQKIKELTSGFWFLRLHSTTAMLASLTPVVIFSSFCWGRSLWPEQVIFGTVPIEASDILPS